MGAGASSRKINKVLHKKLTAAVGLNDRALNILYNRFLYLYMKAIPKDKQQQAMVDLEKKGLDGVKIPLGSIKSLKEFQFHPFADRIVSLFREDMKVELVDLQQFLTTMSVFCVQTEPEKKKKLLFRIYDKGSRGAIPLMEIRSILTE